MQRTTRLAAVGAAAVALGLGLVPLAQSENAFGDPVACSAALADGTALSYDERRSCVIAVATTYLGGEDGTVSPASVLLDDEVARYGLGQDPQHAPANASAMRATWPGDDVARITDPEWTVDGDDAFVSYRVHGTADGPVDHHVAARITLREGLVWEILENPSADSTADTPRTTRTPAREAMALAGPMFGSVDMNAPDYDNGAYCTLYLGESGDAALTPDQERRCLIAIAATYVDAEGNETADSLTLFDPRFSKYSLGQAPSHHPGNGDINRMDQVYLSPTIRLIDAKQYTADPTTGQVWITYDGYLPVSTDKPAFYVAERFTIRNGLIWEIMISPVILDVPAGLVPGGAPRLG